VRNLKSNLLIFIPGFFFLILWEITVYQNTNLIFFFSSPTQIIKSAFTDILLTEYWYNLLFTTSSALSGLFLGTIVGTTLGIVLWLNPLAEKISRPYITALGAVPIFAIAPMLILWFGIGIFSKIMMAFLSVVLVSLFQASEGARQVANQHLIFAQTLGASNYRIVKHIILPGAANSVINGMKMNVNFAIMGTFIAEFISSEYGIGHFILKAGGTYDTPRVFVGILTLIALSLTIQSLIKFLTPKRHRLAKKL
jgi:NitT/TauT family transport system permease protein